MAQRSDPGLTSIKPTRVTQADLLRAWPGPGAIARDLGLSYFTVHSWVRRNMVPERYWEALAQAAAIRGLRHVNYEAFRAIAWEGRIGRFPLLQPPVQVQSIHASPATPHVLIDPDRTVTPRTEVVQDAQGSNRTDPQQTPPSQRK